jgi:hypothetical protein
VVVQVKIKVSDLNIRSLLVHISSYVKYTFLFLDNERIRRKIGCYDNRSIRDLILLRVRFGGQEGNGLILLRRCIENQDPGFCPGVKFLLLNSAQIISNVISLLTFVEGVQYLTKFRTNFEIESAQNYVDVNLSKSSSKRGGA